MELESGAQAAEKSLDTSGDVTDDGIAMALLEAAYELADVQERIRLLAETHASRRGVAIAA